MRALIKSFARDEEGATIIEYGLIVALVAVAAIAAMEVLGESILTGVYRLIVRALGLVDEVDAT